MSQQLSNHNNQKKIAIINDLTGFGKCSIAVELPIISAMAVQCCPVPTSIFSNHTAYPEYFFDDYTDKMQDYIDNWKKLGLRFQGILTGYLCDIRQIDIVRKFIKEFRDQSTIVVVDPVMGDNGSVYSGYSSKVCQGITELVKSADIVMPNLTEACLITSRDYKEVVINHKLVEEMAKEISEMGPEKVVISGILKDNMIGDYVFEKDGAKEFLFNDIVGISREGTGDVFSAIIAADAVNDVPFVESVKKGSDFIRRCLVISDERNIPREDGICFEDLLTTLH